MPGSIRTPRVANPKRLFATQAWSGSTAKCILNVSLLDKILIFFATLATVRLVIGAVKACICKCTFSYILVLLIIGVSGLVSNPVSRKSLNHPPYVSNFLSPYECAISGCVEITLPVELIVNWVHLAALISFPNKGTTLEPWWYAELLSSIILAMDQYVWTLYYLNISASDG